MKQKKNKSDFADFVLDQLSALEGLKVRAMFGGLSLYCNGLIFAIIADDALYFKVDEENRPNYVTIGSQPFSYIAKNNKRVALSYFEVPLNILEDPEQLCLYAQKSVDCSLRCSSKQKNKKTPDL